MKPFISMSLLTKLTAILLLIISIMPRGWADESAPKKTMVLRQIMQELDSKGWLLLQKRLTLPASAAFCENRILAFWPKYSIKTV
ncbi:MAG: hypothetical protein IPM78_10725 [Moraxellaceae bacterium]|nr:hypothetical protein [Moraxellaceae bacterium]